MRRTKSLGGRFGNRVVLVGAIALLAGVGPVLAKKVIERFNGHAINISGRATQVEIGVFEWSTEEDRKALIAAFNEGGNNGAYDWMRKQKEKGFVKAPNTLGYQMRYAFQAEQDGKRVVVLGTDRPIAMGEVMQDSWTKDNNISIVSMELDLETGKGEGRMIFGAEFGVDKKTGQLTITSVSTNPTELKKIVTKTKKKD